MLIHNGTTIQNTSPILKAIIKSSGYITRFTGLVWLCIYHCISVLKAGLTICMLYYFQVSWPPEWPWPLTEKCDWRSSSTRFFLGYQSEIKLTASCFLLQSYLCDWLISHSPQLKKKNQSKYSFVVASIKKAKLINIKF